MMDRQVRTMTRFVEDLLDVSRISKGKIRFRTDVLDLRALVASIVEAAGNALRARDQTVELQLADTPVFIRGDETRCEQMIGNLVNNASKFSDDGARIEMELRVEERGMPDLDDENARDRAPLTAVVSVRDDGLGIDPEVLPRIFEPFVQADRSLARSQGGLGIGLTLVKSIAEAHGGEVEAKSDGLGEGSEFILRLPAFESRRHSDASEQRRPERGPVTPKRVVVVDDNPDAAESLSMLLRVSGHDVQTAHSGHEALEVVAAQNPDVVILDIGLPGLDGYQVAREIRKRPGNEDTVLIALSGYGAEEDRRRAYRSGFNHHMTKPPDAKVLETLFTTSPPPRRKRS
jgi:CheY-like chemotaxis protein